MHDLKYPSLEGDEMKRNEREIKYISISFQESFRSTSEYCINPLRRSKAKRPQTRCFDISKSLFERGG